MVTLISVLVVLLNARVIEWVLLMNRVLSVDSVIVKRTLQGHCVIELLVVTISDH